jgi:hypothetical protein
MMRLRQWNNFPKWPKSHANGFHAFGDLLDGNQIAAIATGTPLGRSLPIVGRLKIAFPKWPRATLNRPNRVDRATGTAFEEDAIVVGLFFQTSSKAFLARVQTKDFFERFAAKFSDDVDVAVRHPDKTGLSRAAIAALGALESQPIGIPGR